MKELPTILSCFVLLFVVSCQRSGPDSSVGIERLANAYAQLAILNERTTLAKDSLSFSQYGPRSLEILKKYGYTKEQFMAEFQTVSRSPDQFKQMCDLAVKRAEHLRVDSTRSEPKL
jgi:hypothetical protein